MPLCLIFRLAATAAVALRSLLCRFRLAASTIIVVILLPPPPLTQCHCCCLIHYFNQAVCAAAVAAVLPHPFLPSCRCLQSNPISCRRRLFHISTAVAAIMPLPLPPRHACDATMFLMSSCRCYCCCITAAVAKPSFRRHCRCLCRITSILPPTCCFCQAKFGLPPLSMPYCHYCYRHLLLGKH